MFVLLRSNLIAHENNSWSLWHIMATIEDGLIHSTLSQKLWNNFRDSNFLFITDLSTGWPIRILYIINSKLYMYQWVGYHPSYCIWNDCYHQSFLFHLIPIFKYFIRGSLFFLFLIFYSLADWIVNLTSEVELTKKIIVLMF